jgi:hypothetical protein
MTFRCRGAIVRTLLHYSRISQPLSISIQDVRSPVFIAAFDRLFLIKSHSQNWLKLPLRCLGRERKNDRESSISFTLNLLKAIALSASMPRTLRMKLLRRFDRTISIVEKYLDVAVWCVAGDNCN